MEKGIRFENIVKTYNGRDRVIDNFNLDIEDGEFVVLLGPSGCGKSTLLRIIAGLEDIDSGKVYVDGQCINDREPKDRDIAMVFQNYALYPHMTVYKNIGISLMLKKTPKEEVDRRVSEVAGILDIKELLDRKPRQLSGGQMQRVALARAMIRKPKVFLMDEPLSNLDSKLRVQTRGEIMSLYRRLKRTTIYVTHDQVEAMTMATTIVLMKNGVIQQKGHPEELYERPQNMFVAGFIGSPQMNFIDSNINGQDVVIGFRPEDCFIAGEKDMKEQDENLKSVFSEFLESMDKSFNVDNVENLGSEKFVYLGNDGKDRITVRCEASRNIIIGEKVHMGFNLEKLHVFSKKTKERLETV